MKRVLALICIAAICFSLIGCTQEGKTYDKQFLKAFKQGLMDRWDESTKEDSESKESRTKLVYCELRMIEKYLDKQFSDAQLQEYAIAYINILNKQKEAVSYFDIDYEKYITMWSRAYDERTLLFDSIINAYNIEFPKKYQSTVDELLANSRIVEEENILYEQVEEMKNSIDFQPVEQSGNYTYYQTIIENTTNKVFDTFGIEITLKDENGIILDSEYTSVENFDPGEKAKLDFGTDEEFAFYELDIEYYIDDFIEYDSETIIEVVEEVIVVEEDEEVIAVEEDDVSEKKEADKELLSDEIFTRVLKKYGYDIVVGEDGVIEAKKGPITSMNLHKYESVEKSNEVRDAERSMFMNFHKNEGYELLSYGEACTGVVNDSLIMLTAHKDEMSIICFAETSHKTEIEDILKELGCI